MRNFMTALGIGLVSAVAVPAAAHENYPGNTAPAPTYAHPGYAPAPTYGRPGYAPAPVAAPPAARFGAPELARADFDRNGFVSLREADGYAQGQFARDDRDRNGVLTWREQNQADVFARGDRDGAVNFAEYDARVRREFYALDRNHDGFLSRYELGVSAPVQPTVSWSWRARF